MAGRPKRFGYGLPMRLPVEPHRLALFLDFDGTLAALAPRPDAVHVDPALIPVLQGLHRHLGGALALVSGRPLDELDQFVSPLRLPAAGVHGAQRRDTAGRLHVAGAEPPSAVEAAMRGLVERHPALLLEHKPGALALHYRAAPELEAICLQAVNASLEGLDGWALLHGKCVLEIKPSGIDKGAAVTAFLEEAAFAQRFAVFIGDDVTDEAAIAVVQAAGGLGIKVGEGDTLADQRLDDPAAVLVALHELLAALERQPAIAP